MTPGLPRRWLERGLPLAALGLGVGCLAAILRIVQRIPLHVPYDYNEGWNAYHAAAAMAGHGLYPGAQALMFNNYPPLSFYVVGAFGSIVGDQIIAGRIVSLLSFLALAFAMAAAVRFMGAKPFAVLFSPLLFVAPMLLFSHYVGIDDPQLLGQAVGMSGLALVLARPRSDRAIACAALCFVAALTIKHSLVVQPLVALCWLAWCERRSALLFALVATALGLVVLALCMFAYGGDFLFRLYPPRGYSLATGFASLGGWAADRAVLLGLAGASSVVFFRDRHVRLCALYCGLALVAGTVFVGGDGVDRNVYFDADIALALSVGLFIDRMGRRWLQAAAVYGCLCYFAIAALVVTHADRGPPLPEAEAASLRDVAFLRHADGPALCVTLALCYWAGKLPQVDAFNLDQHAARDPEQGARLLRLVASTYFRAMMLGALDQFPHVPQFAATVARFYRVDHQDRYGIFLLPK